MTNSLIQALESIQLVRALGNYSNKKQLSNESVNLANVALESICELNNIINNVSLESMAAVNMEPVVNTLFEKVNKESTELLLDLLKRINSRKKTLYAFTVDATDLTDRLEHLDHNDTMPLLGNIQPYSNVVLLMNQDGLDVPGVLERLRSFSNDIIDKIDELVLNTNTYIYQELNNPSETLSTSLGLEPKDMTVKINENIHGLTNLIVNYDWNISSDIIKDDDALAVLRSYTVTQTELLNVPLRAELNTQEVMNLDEWLKFNSTPRLENDKSVIKTLTLNECDGLLADVIEIKDRLIKINNDMLINAFASSEFTDTVNRLIHLSEEDFNDKKQFLYELFVSVMNIYQSFDDIIMQLCNDYILALNSYIFESIRMYECKK